MQTTSPATNQAGDTLHAADLALPSDPGVARLFQDEIEQLLQHHHASEKDIFGIRLALEEALVNAIKHGNQLDPGKQVHVSYRLHRNCFDIVIRDEGPGFDPEDVPDPSACENLERPCGRGLMLMRFFMTHVAFSNNGRVVTMSKMLHTNGKTGG